MKKMARVPRTRDQVELFRLVKLKELRVVMNRTRIGQPLFGIRPQPPLPILYEAPTPDSALAPPAPPNVRIVQNGTYAHHQPLQQRGNTDSRETEDFPVLTTPTNRTEEGSVLNQSELSYWVGEECANGSCVSRNVQIVELIDSVQRMTTYMSDLQGKVRILEDEKKQLQLQLSSSNLENEKLKNDASKMEKELQQRGQPESEPFLKAVGNLKEEFQMLSLKVEDALEKMSSAVKDFQGFKDLGNKMEGLCQKMEQLEEKMEQRGKAEKGARLVFKGFVTTKESSTDCECEFTQCCHATTGGSTNNLGLEGMNCS